LHDLPQITGRIRLINVNQNGNLINIRHVPWSTKNAEAVGGITTAAGDCGLLQNHDGG
jgi:hypothetical protein